MTKTHRIQKIGGSFYLYLPPSNISEQMLKQGVTIEVIHYDGINLILHIRAGEPNGEHTKDTKQSGKNTP